MSAFGNTRRGFLREMGLGAAFAIPVLVAGRQLSADERDKSVPFFSSRPRKNKLAETDVLVVGGG